MPDHVHIFLSAPPVVSPTEIISKGAEAFDHNTIKKHEQMNVKLGMLDPLYYLMFSTNEKISITQIEGNWPQAPFPSREAREEFVKDWPQLPDEKFKQYFLDWEPRGEYANPYYPTPEIASEIVDWMEMLHNIDDALGLCAGMGSFCFKPAFHIHNYPKFISAATGMDLDQAGLKKTVNRSRNLHRAFNNRRGMSRADEKPPADHWKHRFPELEEKLLTDEDVRHLLEERAIRAENVQRVIEYAEKTGNKLVNRDTGRFLAHYRPGTATFWVEYAPAGDGFRVYNAYSHMMRILGEEGA